MNKNVSYCTIKTPIKISFKWFSKTFFHTKWFLQLIHNSNYKLYPIINSIWANLYRRIKIRIMNITNHLVLNVIKMNVTLLLHINVDRGRCSMRHWFLWARLLIAYFRLKGAWNLYLSLFCWIISIKLRFTIRKKKKNWRDN